ncbi:unnamed protein product [Rotaria sordida]|uniref:Uncharacterized protein n=2 Tax=Rotaria sordida TaxID=392033 RepID=A0A814GK22_9BILA|nr:unnamed protein product [Rotaria sordida]
MIYRYFFFVFNLILHKEKNNNRSDPSRMNNIDQTRLARLRPEKLDDVSVKEQILLIQKACGNVNPEKIALVFHECDYNVQQTINRIRAGDFEDGGWQTAKSNNKKKNHNLIDQKINGNNLSDSERSLSQRTSPTSSLRGGGGHHRNDHYQYSTSTRMNIGRRGNDSGRSHFIPSNSRYSLHNKSTKTITSSQPIPNEISSISKQIDEELTQINSPLTDEYEFINGIPQSLSFDNSQMKTSLQTLSKRRISSTIPQEPVSMHPTVKFSTQPIDIQFGDVQWNDSVPIAVSPSTNTIISTTLDNREKDLSSTVDTDNHEENQDIQNILSSNYINHQTTNEIDNPLIETTNQLSSLSITDNTISNSLPIVPPEGTSHLSDHLTDTSSPIPTQYSSQQQVPIQIPMTRLPPTSTPRASEHTSTTSQYMLNNLQQSNNGINSSAFTPFNTLVNYPSMPRDYSQTTTNWNPQTSNYKTNAKPTIISTGTYQQQPSYQIPTQQQQFFLGTYPYSSMQPTVVPVFASIDQWPTGTFSTPIESYPYATANYIPTYPNQQQFHLSTNKYDQQSYDKEFFALYGQTRSLNNDISYQQQQQQPQQSSTLSQTTKDTSTTSKLSPNAATFCQGAPLAASSSTPTTLYLNPVGFSMPNYFPSVPGSIHQDRILSYSTLDNRDNRNGASYSSTNNRNNYYHHGQQQQQQRTYNNNGSNSTWHLQQ